MLTFEITDEQRYEQILPRIRQVAKAGAMFLDEKRTGWHRRIDLGELNLASSYSCILGQLEGDYWNGGEHLGFQVPEMGERVYAHSRVARLGFALSHTQEEGRGDLWNDLTLAWKHEIVERLKADEEVSHGSHS